MYTLFSKRSKREVSIRVCCWNIFAWKRVNAHLTDLAQIFLSEKWKPILLTDHKPFLEKTMLKTEILRTIFTTPSGVVPLFVQQLFALHYLMGKHKINQFVVHGRVYVENDFLRMSALIKYFPPQFSIWFKFSNKFLTRFQAFEMRLCTRFWAESWDDVKANQRFFPLSNETHFNFPFSIFKAF